MQAAVSCTLFLSLDFGHACNGNEETQTIKADMLCSVSTKNYYIGLICVSLCVCMCIHIICLHYSSDHVLSTLYPHTDFYLFLLKVFRIFYSRSAHTHRHTQQHVVCGALQTVKTLSVPFGFSNCAGLPQLQRESEFHSRVCN